MITRCKKYVAIIPLVLLFHLSHSQSEPRYLFRIQEDNDLFNVIGGITDWSYSNGTRFDFFFTKQQNRKPSFYEWLPSAGKESKRIYAWSLLQMMVTPKNLWTSLYQPNDYNYAGALLVSHSLYSLNSSKRLAVQTELSGGIRGPYSFAKQTQTEIHSIVQDPMPRGWNNQLKTQLLANINFTVEKGMLSLGNVVEVIGGVQWRVGSFMDAMTFYPLVRIGKMSSYFEGPINSQGSFSRYGRMVKTQYYFFFKPSASFVAYNALVEGAREHVTHRPGIESVGSDKSLAHRVSDMQAGIVISHGNVSLGYAQTFSTPYLKDLYNHSFGTITFSMRWL
jgi:hypothetical protein